MRKEIILFDWDDTLFSKDEYKKKLGVSLAKMCSVSNEQILELQETYINSLERSDNFHINDFLKYLSQKTKKEIDIKDFDSRCFEIYSKSLFPETISVLNTLKEKFTLGIYSQGFEDFQKTKINSSGIKHFFDEKSIYITRNKRDLEFLEKLPKGATIIDDKKDVIEKLKTTKRFNLFWLNRHDDEKIDGVITVKNLNEFCFLKENN